MKHARLYARVSTEEQSKKGLSIPVQIEKLKQYCKDNEYEIIDTYIDNGISAATIKKRHEFVRMLNDLQPNDTILVTRLDRMSRNVYGANYLLEKFNPLNVRFKAILEDDIDTTTADGKFIFDLKVSLAERERKKTSERIKDVFESKRAKGEWTAGKPPLGYMVDEKQHLTLHPNDSKGVKFLFEEYNKGRSIKEIRQSLIEKFNINYTIHGLYNVMNNKRYYGFYGDVPIITESLFHSANNKRRIIKYTEKVKDGRVYLFQTLVKCPCGNTMYACSYRRNGVEKKRYQCKNDYFFHDGKKHLGISEIKLEKQFIQEIVKRFGPNSIGVTETVKESDISKVDDAIKKKDRLKEMYIEGFISRDEFDDRLAELEPIINSQFNQQQDIDLTTITDIKEFYNSLSEKEKQVFISSLVKEIKLNQARNIIITFK